MADSKYSARTFSSNWRTAHIQHLGSKEGDCMYHSGLWQAFAQRLQQGLDL